MGSSKSSRSGRKLFAHKVDAWLRDRLISSKQRRPKDALGETCLRYLNFLKFCCVCSASLLQVMGPWVLCCIEVVSVLLLYVLGTSPPRHQLDHGGYSFHRSLADVVCVSIARAGILCVAYGWVMHMSQRSCSGAHRAYVYLCTLLALLVCPYVVVKIFLFSYGHDAVSCTLIMGLASMFSCVHVVAARHAYHVTRRSLQLGLAGFTAPTTTCWDDVEAAMQRPPAQDMAKGRSSSRDTDGGGGTPGGAGGGDGDVPPESLAHEHSRFVDVNGVRVHYVEVLPPLPPLPVPQQLLLHPGGASQPALIAHHSAGSSCSLDDPLGLGDAVVLVHGYGGGTFAWRHVMEELAAECQCRVIAFDRPGFGLTSRPAPGRRGGSGGAGMGGAAAAGGTGGVPNPYSSSAQGELALALAGELGVRRVVMVAHGDAVHVVLRAAQLSADAHGGAAGAAAAAAAAAAGAAASRYSRPCSCSSQDSRGAGGSGGSSPSSHMRSSSGYVSAVPCEGGDGCLSGADEDACCTPAHLPEAVHIGGVVAPADQARMSPLAAVGDSDACGGGEVRPPPEVLMAGDTSGRGAAPASAAAAAAAASAFDCMDSASAASAAGTAAVAAGAEAAVVAATAPGDVDGAATTSCTPSHAEPHAATASPMLRLQRLAQQEVGVSRPPPINAAALPVAGGVGGVGVRGFTPPPGPRFRHCLSNPGLAALAELGSSPAAPQPAAAFLPQHEITLRTPVRGGWPVVVAVALLHPNLASGGGASTLSQLLAHSGFGRPILRALMRSEVGEVANRRAWHNQERLTPEVLALYKAPMRVQGWDLALMEVARQGSADAPADDLAGLLAAARQLPLLLATGEHDAVVSPARAHALWARLPHASLAVLPDCGHLSHEEAPQQLLQQLAPFVSQQLHG